MKAKYIKENTEYENLLLGDIYKVEDVICKKQKNGRHYGEVLKIQIRNNKGELCWYETKYFELHAEAMEYAIAEAAIEAHKPALKEIAKEATTVTMTQNIVINSTISKLDTESITEAVKKIRQTIMYGA